jgi:predicted metal-dependent phosphoesterase TrpH
LTHFAYPTLAGYLVANKFCSTLQEAFGLLAGMKVRSDDVSTERAIEVVHQAGGYATLAHPFAPKISLRNISKEASELLSICRELKESGLDGIEVYTPAHKDEDIAFAEEVAKELDLFPNIGSDWHGPISNDDPQREFIPRYPIQYREAFLNIPENVVQDLIERFSKSSH